VEPHRGGVLLLLKVLGSLIYQPEKVVPLLLLFFVSEALQGSLSIVIGFIFNNKSFAVKLTRDLLGNFALLIFIIIQDYDRCIG